MKIKPLTLSLLALLFVFATQTFAATFVVNDGGDLGDTICDVTCTLREAVEAANAAGTNDTITFAVGLTSIILSNEISISNNGTLTIAGGGADVLTIDGGPGANRIFHINDATVTITGATLTGGNGSGAAIYFISGNLTLDAIVVRDNVASGSGGGVYLGTGGFGTYSISNSTFSGNQDNDCAGFRLDGGTLTVNNSTLSGNQATGGVGGAFCSIGGDLTMRNSTVTGNSAPGIGGGGIYQGGGTTDLGNTIIAGNTGDIHPEIYFGGGILTSSGFNLIGDSTGDSTNTSTGILYQPTDKVDMDPMLGPLSIANGGKTPTHALLVGSPAIDQGSSFSSVTEQRGFLRPYDDTLATNAVGSDASDIGAFEKQLGPSAAMVSAGGRVTSPNGRGISGARVTITDATGVTRAAISNTFGYYRFTDVPAGQSYFFGVSSRRHTFAQSTLFSSIMDDIDAINFVSKSN